MSGNPGFQGNAFQNTAFQAGVLLVGASYSLGSPVFAKPALSQKHVLSASAYSLGPLDIPLVGRTLHTLSVSAYSLGSLGWPSPPPSMHFNYHFSAAAYAVGSPIFSLPPLSSHPSGSVHPITVNPYSLASPVFRTPAFNQVYALHINAYSTSSPDFGTSNIGQNYHLFVNAWALNSPVFDAPRGINNYVFSAAAYSLAPPMFVPPHAPITVDYALHIDAYWLQSPWPNHPHLTVSAVELGLPPLYYTQAEDAAKMLTELLNLILKSVPPQQTAAGDQLRRYVSILRANAEVAVRAENSTLGTDLQVIYAAADAAGASFMGMDNVRKFLMSQVASNSVLTQAIYRNALIMTLAEQSKIASRFPFKTQAQIENLMTYMSAAFDNAKALGIDEVDALVYQTLTAMGGALMNHLGTTELQLPRYVSYRAAMPFPSLYLAQRIYCDPSRSDEIESENDVINPAFCPINLRVLSTAVIGTTIYGRP